MLRTSVPLIGALERTPVRPAKRPWQATLGIVWTASGALGFVGVAGLHYLNSAPTLDDLRPVSGTVQQDLKINCDSRYGSYTQFSIRGSAGIRSIRIDNWGCHEPRALSMLGPGSEASAWILKEDIDQAKTAPAWKLKIGERVLLDLRQSRKLHHEQEARLWRFTTYLLLVGTTLYIWGRVIGKRKIDSAL